MSSSHEGIAKNTTAPVSAAASVPPAASNASKPAQPEVVAGTPPSPSKATRPLHRHPQVIQGLIGALGVFLGAAIAQVGPLVQFWATADRARAEKAEQANVVLQRKLDDAGSLLDAAKEKNSQLLKDDSLREIKDEHTINEVRTENKLLQASLSQETALRQDKEKDVLRLQAQRDGLAQGLFKVSMMLSTADPTVTQAKYAYERDIHDVEQRRGVAERIFNDGSDLGSLFSTLSGNYQDASELKSTITFAREILGAQEAQIRHAREAIQSLLPEAQSILVAQKPVGKPVTVTPAAANTKSRTKTATDATKPARTKLALVR